MATSVEVAKKTLTDVQAVITEALDNLDKLPKEVPMDTAIAAVHTCAEGYEQFMDNLTIEACCHILLKKYQGHEPSLGDVLSLKDDLEKLLTTKYNVSVGNL